MNSIIDAYDSLGAALTADPLLLLASTVATFDPYWSEFDEGYNDDEDNPLHIAVTGMRGAFYDIYADADDAARFVIPGS
jgi:hypothetical protein